MGAEGGVNWIYINGGPDGMRRFRDLISPFYPLHWADHSTSDGDPHWQYLDDHPLPKECYASTYGTNQTFQGMEDFMDMVYELTLPESEALRQMTFGDLCLELMTRPDDLRYQTLTLFEQVCLESFGIGYKTHRWEGPNYYTYELWEDGPTPRALGNIPNLLDLQIQEWLSSVLELVDLECKVWSEETWT